MCLSGIKVDYSPKPGQKISAILQEVKQLVPCPGVTDLDLQQFADLKGKDHYTCHELNPAEPGKLHTSIRSWKCVGSLQGTLRCKPCAGVRDVLRSRKTRSLKPPEPLKPKAPLQNLPKSKLQAAIKYERKHNKSLARDMNKIKKKLEKESISLSEKMHCTLYNVMKDHEFKDSFAKLFWQEQEKNFGRKAAGRRWHSMIVRWAIMLHSQSTKAYNSLKDSGLMVLPGESTLREYSNYVTPSQGFNPQVIVEKYMYVEYNIYVCHVCRNMIKESH